MLRVILTSLIGIFSITEGYAAISTVDIGHGSFKVINKGTSTVLAAPHGTYDINTGIIVNDACRKLQISCVIANGFNPAGTRINVNRPTEGVGKKSSKEPRTIRAKESYKEFKKYVLNVAEPNLVLYVEIHGSGIKGMEVALHNISLSEARIVKKIIKEEWRNHSNSSVSIKVEGIDRIKMTGGAVKKFGIVAELQPKYIQFEFSRKLRNGKGILSKFLASSIRRINSEL